MANAVLQMAEGGEGALRRRLAEAGFTFEPRPHAHFLARGRGVAVIAYESGKVVVNGKDARAWARRLAATPGLPVEDVAVERRVSGGGFQTRVGTDEAGKGDYFGPLVVAGVRVATEDDEAALARLGVRDSKRLTDAHAFALDRAIRDRAPAAVVAVPPPRYNALMEEMGNLNKLLAWAHARCIEDLLARAHAPLVVSDQFARAEVLEGALMERGRRARLVQTPRGERDVAVAAASVVARAEFLRGLNRLSAEWGVELPKGAGAPVDRAARALVEARGADALRRVAKVHFRTTKKALEE